MMTDLTKRQQWLFVVEGDGVFEVYEEGFVEAATGEKEPAYGLIATGFATCADAERFIARCDSAFFDWFDAARVAAAEHGDEP
jgi:hypothetical protein